VRASPGGVEVLEAAVSCVAAFRESVRRFLVGLVKTDAARTTVLSGQGGRWRRVGAWLGEIVKEAVWGVR
jgi:hypothetical protein